MNQDTGSHQTWSAGALTWIYQPPERWEINYFLLVISHPAQDTRLHPPQCTKTAYLFIFALKTRSPSESEKTEEFTWFSSSLRSAGRLQGYKKYFFIQKSTYRNGGTMMFKKDLLWQSCESLDMVIFKPSSRHHLYLSCLIIQKLFTEQFHILGTTLSNSNRDMFFSSIGSWCHNGNLHVNPNEI